MKAAVMRSPTARTVCPLRHMIAGKLLSTTCRGFGRYVSAEPASIDPAVDHGIKPRLRGTLNAAREQSQNMRVATPGIRAKGGRGSGPSASALSRWWSPPRRRAAHHTSGNPSTEPGAAQRRFPSLALTLHLSQMEPTFGSAYLLDSIGGKGGTRTLDPGIMSAVL